jgi:glycosyltransferase involved in cell wall biosynthesis
MSVPPASATLPAAAPGPDDVRAAVSACLPRHPGVSLVLCALNEERHVAEAVAHALDQDYEGARELVIALGPSRDATDEIVAELAAEDPRIVAVRNPSPTGATPAGLNAAISASRYPVVVRLDGHALLPPDYVRTAVETMQRTGAANVGGVMAAEGATAFQRAVARAMTSRLGVGSAAFHVGGTEGPADTVYLGAFRRGVLEVLGGYDEQFLRAQDWEMNLRIRRAGGLVWFTPAMRVSYRPRASVAALACQYFHYGRWRRVVMRRHEGTASLRYLAPPATLLTVLAGSAVALAGWWPGVVLPAGYLLAVVAGGLLEGGGLQSATRLRLPLVLVTMHMAWAVGFLTSPRRLARSVSGSSPRGLRKVAGAGAAGPDPAASRPGRRSSAAAGRPAPRPSHRSGRRPPEPGR